VKKALLLPTLAIVLAGAGSANSAGGFSANVTNPWFPLPPGTTYTYNGIKDGKRSHELLVPSSRVKVIAGAPCRAVDDRLFIAGHLEERTTDWYTQDAKGNVWYFGEQTAELNANGKVISTEGSWQAGVDGAKPGIFMPAHPRPGQSFRQEYLKGHAEDHFRVVAFLGPNALLTEEWTPLEPGVLDHKMYVRGTGTALERTVKGGDELNELVSVTR
jgi:hypothetical protein